MNAYQQKAAKRRMQFKLNRVTKYFNFKPKSITGLTVMMFFVVGAFYVVLVNVVADKGNDLREMDVENRQLEAENQRLEVESARLKSLKVINESATGEVEVGEEAGDAAGEDALVPVGETTQIPTADQSVTVIGDEGAFKIAATPPKFVPSAKINYLKSYGR